MVATDKKINYLNKYLINLISLYTNSTNITLVPRDKRKVELPEHSFYRKWEFFEREFQNTYGIFDFKTVSFLRLGKEKQNGAFLGESF